MMDLKLLQHPYMSVSGSNKMAERFKTSQDLWHNQAVYEAQKRELKTIFFYN